ncbi:MAG: hypothetical protein NXI32_02370 [bacterium]|nr:hypothetical protein [bacterium]
MAPRQTIAAHCLPVLFWLGLPALFWLATLSASPLEAQDNQGSAGLNGRLSETRYEALEGQPFGVLSVDIPLPEELTEQLLGAADPVAELRVLVRDRQNRVCFPVVRVLTATLAESENERPLLGRRGRLGGRILNRLREVLDDGKDQKSIPVGLHVAALFRGTGPMTLELAGDLQQEILVSPAASDQRQFNISLRSWWEHYTQHARETIEENDFPKLVHKYLVAMLANRLGLPDVDLDGDSRAKGGELEQPLKTLSLLAGIEPLREQILEDLLRENPERSTAELPPPESPQWTPTNLPEDVGAVEIESIASRVPPECFYLRFSSFSNFVWMQDIAERYGGDFAQAVVLRGYTYDASSRMERMLAAKMTQLAKMFGDNLIEDMALVGSDLYMTEGPSLGVIFHAKNASLLATAIRADRQAIARQNPDASVGELEIEGKTVLRLSTPDNRIRSFFATDGDYVMVTTSQRLVERFLQVGNGGPSLAETDHFRWTRSWMPLANQYNIFMYFSPEFFQQLVSPQYQIELQRRLEAIAHLEIAELASELARSEGIDGNQISELKASGLLPSWFDERADGAQTLRSGDRWIDSLRGARGSFLPIADVDLVSVTQREYDEYSRLAKYYQQQWRQMDPMVIGIRRFQSDLGADAEKVAFEAYIAPFEAKKYGWVGRQLGSATPTAIQLPEDDLASLQVRMRGNSLLAPDSEDYHLFAGVKDMAPPNLEESKGLLQTLQALKTIPAYIGAWPKPGLVELLPILGKNLAIADANGYSRIIGGLWRWQDSAFSLLSFDRSILENAIAQLAILETEDLAQARLKISNLDQSQMSDWVNQQWYQRGWKSSHANALLLDTVNQQLKVPSADCLQTAERLLDVKLQCPIGGEYQLAQVSSQNSQPIGWWISSAWESANANPESLQPLPPADYTAPWIEWFRGGKMHLTQGTQSLSLVGELSLEMQAPSIDPSDSSGSVLPQMNFDIFSLPSKIFGSSKNNDAPKRRQF